LLIAGATTRIARGQLTDSETWVLEGTEIPQEGDDPAHCGGLVAWEINGTPPDAVRRVLSESPVRVGRTESYAGFFGTPEDAPRYLFIANVGPFTLTADVDRLAETVDEAARKL
jgi:hypothetical protein